MVQQIAPDFGNRAELVDDPLVGRERVRPKLLGHQTVAQLERRHGGVTPRLKNAQRPLEVGGRAAVVGVRKQHPAAREHGPAQQRQGWIPRGGDLEIGPRSAPECGRFGRVGRSDGVGLTNLDLRQSDPGGICGRLGIGCPKEPVQPGDGEIEPALFQREVDDPGQRGPPLGLPGRKGQHFFESGRGRRKERRLPEEVGLEQQALAEGFR